jgi:Gpi18-like mannosyltransferase
MSLLLFGATRLGIFLIAYLAAPLIADSPSPPYHLRPPDNILVDVFGSRWDTGFYVSIAEEGYRYEGVELPSVAFFPLLPLVMRTLTPLVGDALLAGILVSNVALLLATMLLYRLVDEGWGEATAGRATWYFLIFPAAFFGAAVYTESLFLLGAIGALYFARRGYWEIAALLGVAAALTRFIGLIVAVMLLVEWWAQWRAKTSDRRPSVLALAAPAVVPLGTSAYMTYLWRVFGDPLAFMHGAAAWARQPQSPLATLATLFETPAGGWGPTLLAGHIHIDNWLDFGFAALFLVFAIVLLYQKRWSEGTFVLLGVVLALSSGLLMSQRSYMWVLFPAFILLAQWGTRTWADKLITTISLLLLALFTAMFANGYWVG